MGSAIGNTATNHRFAVWMAVAMLAITLIGFGPTLFFRPMFEVPEMPLYLYIHGAVGSAWFLLVVVQATLINGRHFKLHRWLGWLGVLLAVSVLVSGVYTSTNMVPRNVALGLTSEADIRLYGFVTAADLAAFVVFPTLVIAAIWFRRRTDVHMRLMLLATLEILGPAIARIASWFGEIPNPVVPLLFLCFVAALMIYDVRRHGRVHWASVLGTLLIIVVNASMQLSGIGQTLVSQRLGL